MLIMHHNLQVDSKQTWPSYNGYYAKVCLRNYQKLLQAVTNLIVGITVERQSEIVSVIDLFAEAFSTLIDENSHRYNDGQLVTVVALI